LGEADGEAGRVGAQNYDYNALGALKLNAGVPLAHERPRLDGAGLADAAVPATLGGQPVTLDAGGRVTSLRGTSFTWSAQGFVRQAQDPVPAAPELYGVDSNLRRISTTQSGSSEVYVFEGLDRIATLAPNGTVKEGYLFDGIDHPLRIKVAATNTTAYYELDLAGNVRGLRASGGASLGGYRYSAFGQTLEDTSSITQPLRWKGRWFSPVAGGTYDVRARQWSPELGSFLSVDEFRYHDKNSTLWGWPSMNPAHFRDSTGRKQDFDLRPRLPNLPDIPTTCRQWCDFNHDADIDQCRNPDAPRAPSPPPGDTCAPSPHDHPFGLIPSCDERADEKLKACEDRCKAPFIHPIPGNDDDVPFFEPKPRSASH
jgi:RHS repeat-associated protein